MNPCDLPGGEGAWVWGGWTANLVLAAVAVGTTARRGLGPRGTRVVMGAASVVLAHPALWMPAGGPGCGVDRARSTALFLLLGVVLALWTRLRPAP